MGETQLSRSSQEIIERLPELTRTEVMNVISIAGTQLARMVAQKALTARHEALAKAEEFVAEQINRRTAPIDEMKTVLREADCLYDKAEIWRQLGAKEVPELPYSVIQEAYTKGGRVILRSTSISEKADALCRAGHAVEFWGDAKKAHYQYSGSKLEWVVIPSHIDKTTLGCRKSVVVTPEMPPPTLEDWFSVLAYARVDRGGQPEGCEGLFAFTTEYGTIIGPYGDDVAILVHRDEAYERIGAGNTGAVRFGRFSFR